MPLTESQARKRVEELKGYYGNLAAYAIVVPGLALIDWLTGPGAWAYWPALGWGIGLVSHTVATFGVFGSRAWEERKVRELTGTAEAEASASRLRALVREAVGERGAPADETERLRRRVEHLEAIVTSREFDAFVEERAPAPALTLPDDAPDESAEAQAARLARRVR